MTKRSEPPLSSTSTLPPAAKKQQQTNLNFFAKPSTSGGSGSKGDGKFKEQPHLKSKSTGGACHVVYGDWKGSSKIAAFDLDGTIIKTKSGIKFAKGATDWVYWNSIIPETLRDLVRDGFSIVFISNQAGQRHVQQAFVEKLALIGKSLNPDPTSTSTSNVAISFRAFGAFDYDQYRKPCSGTWERFQKEFNEGIVIDYKESFFCGDAAGRPKNVVTGKEADHSDCDRKMAYNVDLTFHTPEEYFLKEKVDSNWKWDKVNWDPKTYDHDVPIFSPTNTPLISKSSLRKQEVVFLIGPPASGKTFFFHQYFEGAGYISINPDETTRALALAALKSQLTSSKTQSLILDSRFQTQVSRNHYLSLLKSDFPEVGIRACYFTGDLGIWKHNSFYRALGGANTSISTSTTDFDPSPLSSSSSSYTSNSNDTVLRIAREIKEAERGVTKEDEFISDKPPSEIEGFEEIKLIQFRFCGTDLEKKNWSRWLDAGRKVKIGTAGGWGGKR